MSASPRRRLILGGLAIVAFFGTFWVIGRSQPPPVSRTTITLLAFLRERGIDVRFEAEPGNDRGTALLLQDHRTPAQEELLLDWVEGGGTLVVADPGSNLLAATGQWPGGTMGGLRERTVAPGCLVPETEGVAEITIAGSDRALMADAPEPVSCFPSGENAQGGYLTRTRRGSGTLVALGGSSFAGNETLLQDPNNAAFVLRLVGDDDGLVMLPPVPPGKPQPRGIWGTVPVPGRVIFFQLLVALVIWLVVKGRRFGSTPGEAPLAPIPANELVRARAGLYQHAAVRGHAADKVRAATRARILTRVGGEGREPVDEMAARVAAVTDMDASEIGRVFHEGDVENDVQLTTKERQMEQITRATEGTE